MQFYKDGTSECRNDVNWYHLRQIRSPIGNNFRFNLLFKVAQIVMLITHSNAVNDWTVIEFSQLVLVLSLRSLNHNQNVLITNQLRQCWRMPGKLL